MDESLDFMLEDRIGDHLGTKDIGLKKSGIIVNRTRDMRFRRKMDNSVALSDKLTDHFTVLDVSLPENKARIFFSTIIKIIKIPRISKSIKDSYSVIGISIE